MVEPYGFTVIDAGQPIPLIFRALQRHISRLRLTRLRPRQAVKKAKQDVKKVKA